MKQKVSFLCIVFILSTILGSPIYAQRGFRIGNEMKTPSTDTWNFIKHGTVGANLHTGTVNLSIPVYTYKDNDFEIPITLDYSSNGLICNMRAGILGPDWVLNAGGIISVEKRGILDFDNTEHANGFYIFHQLENPRTDGTYRRHSNFANMTPELGGLSPEIIYEPDSSENIENPKKYDAEPDIYHFNFMGYSGRFHLGWNNELYVYNTNGDNKLLGVSIEKNGSIIEITIIDKYGYKYIFDESNTDQIPDSSGELKLDIAYKLSRIIAPNDRYVEFSYESTEMTTYRPKSFYCPNSIYDLNNQNSMEIIPDHQSEIEIYECMAASSILSSISVDSIKIVSFEYESLDSSVNDQFRKIENGSLEEFEDCKRLKNIIVTNPFIVNDTIKIADFTYRATQGARTNYLNSVTLSGEGTYTFGYHNIEDENFPSIGTREVDHWGYYNGRKSGNFLNIVSKNSSTLEESINTSVRNPASNYAKYGMLNKIIYPTGGFSIIDYEAHDYSYAMRQTVSNVFLLNLQEESGICGGLRIKSITNYSSDSTLLNSKNYSYVKNGISSGILLYFPRYWICYSATNGYNCVEPNINFYSNNLLSHEGYHIEYETVTQINSDGSKEVFNFSNSRMSNNYRDESDISETTPEKIPLNGVWTITDGTLIRNIVSPILSKQAERGKLLKHEIYKANSEYPDKIITFGYDTSSFLPYDTYPVYLVRQFGHGHICTDNYKLINTVTEEYFSNTLITNSENIQYNAYYQPSQIITKMSNGNTKITRYEYVSDYKNAGGIYATMNERHLLSYPVTERVYLEDKMGIETLISGRCYTYGLFNNIVKVSKEESYNPRTCQWETTTTYTNYDAQGNLLESKDANGLPTSYIWGYNGLYMVAKIENMYRNSINSTIGTSPLSACLSPAQISSIKTAAPDALVSIYEYKPMVGLSKVVQPSGEVLTYQYNSTGKLMGIYNTKGEKVEENLYSPDNKQ